MKNAFPYLRGFVCAVVLLLTNICGYANHLVGMDLFYTYISGNTYKITLIAYANCGSAGPGTAYAALSTNTPAVYIYNGSSYLSTVLLSIDPPSAGVEITPVCPADLLLTQCTNVSYTIPGIKKFVYSATYTLPGTSPVWRFLFTGDMTGSGTFIAGRALSITNISSTPVTSIQLVDTLNNTTTHNTNAALAVIPTPFFCLNNNDNYNPGATDPDGDALTFSLVPAMDGTATSTPGSPVTYLGTYSATAPLATTSFLFDNLTGQISFYPNALQRSTVVYNIEEHRAGTLVGTCQREMTFLVLTCTNSAPSGGLNSASNGTIDDSTHFHICSGAGAFSLHIDPTEATKTNNIFVTVSGVPSGATFTTTGNGTNAPHCVFSWSTTGVAPGTYTFYVTFTDDNCPLTGVQTLAYTITVLPNPTISYSLISAATCTQKAVITLVPGSTPSWIIKIADAPKDTIQVLSISGAVTDSLAPGTYSITINQSPANGCSSYITATIPSPVVTVPTATFINPTYCGNNDGSIKLHHLIPGQLDTVNFLYNGVIQPPQAHTVAADSTITITGLLAGVYTAITATYGRYCVSAPVGPVTLTAPPFTMRALTSVNPVYCGICNGSIKLYGLHPGQLDTINYTLGGIAQTPFTYLVGTDSTVTINGLCQGTYANIVASTAGVCVSNKLGPVTLTVPPFTMRTLVVTNPSYCGVCDGSIKIIGLHPGQFDTINYTFNGVAQPPATLFIGGDSAITITGLCAGLYDNFYARTAGVCISNKLGPVTLTPPPFTMSAATYTNPVYCGVCNGTILLHGLHPGTLDTVNYTFGGVAQTPVTHFVTSDSLITITGLCAGVYDNFYANTGGCVSNKLGPLTLTVPPFTMRDISFTNPDYCGICDGTIKLYGLYPGQIDTINYTLGGVPQTPFIHLIGTDSTVLITGLCAGVYDNFVARTAGVCVSNKLGPVNLTVPPFTMRALSFTHPSYCGICNGSIKLYGLYPGELDTVHYTLNGVAQTPLSFTVASDSTIMLFGLCAGLYDSFFVTAGGVCVSNVLGPANLTVPPFTMRALSFTNPDYCGVCNGTITLYGLFPGETDTISYTLNGIRQAPVSYTIGGDSTVKFTGLCAGVYDSFVATTGAVCVSNMLGPANLTIPPFTMRAISYTNPDFCGICNGTITLYGLHPGETDSIYYTVGGVLQLPIVKLIGSDSTVKLTGLCAGYYDHFVARTGGVCVSNTLGPADLVVPPFTIDRLTFTNPTKCGFCDGSVSLYGLHPSQIDTVYYRFNGVTQTPVVRLIAGDSLVQLTNLCEGTYDSIIARTGGVCATNMVGPALLKAPPITAEFKYDLRKNCKADTVYFTNGSTPASDLTYRWNFGDSTASIATDPVHVYTTPGILKTTLIVTNTKCFDTTAQDITLDNLMTAAFTDKPDSFLCQGSNAVFTNQSAGTGLSYTWNFGDGYMDNATNPAHTFYNTGNFKVTMIAANNMPCYDTVTRYLAVDSMSFIGIQATDTVLCGGHTVTFVGSYATSGLRGVVWTFSDGSTVVNESQVTKAFDYPGYFPVTVKAIYRACPDTSATTSVRIFGNPEIYLGPDTTICPGSEALVIGDQVNGNNKHARWLWNTGETTPFINVVRPGDYYSTVTISGCDATDSVVVLNDCYMNIPNIFSPNGDGLNDYFFPRGLLTRGLITFQMDIFNRWGQQVFSTNSTDGRGWDGTFNGTPQPEGVFVYRIQATFKDGQIEKHTGNVTLIR